MTSGEKFKSPKRKYSRIQIAVTHFPMLWCNKAKFDNDPIDNLGFPYKHVNGERS